MSNLIHSLNCLNIKKPDCVYCHVSLKNSKVSIGDSKKFIEQLINYFGSKCTIAAPSFPYGAFIDDYAEYVSKQSIKYDVELTPAKVNLFGELFRRRIGTRRSLNPILPVGAIGPLANHIISEDHLEEKPFGTKSSFVKMLYYNTYIIGIGLDINTNTFIHLVDNEFSHLFPNRIYSEYPVAATLLKNNKVLDKRKYYYLTPEICKKIKPIKLHPFILKEKFYCFIDGDIKCYSLKLSEFVDHSKNLVKESFNLKQLPVWHNV